MKKQSGISMIALVVTIIVIIILAMITVTSGLDSVDEARETKLDVEIRNIKDAVNNRIIKNTENPSKYPLAGQTVEDVTEYIYFIDNMTNAEIEEFVNGINEDNIEYFRLLDSQAAKSLGVDSVDENHYFIVDYYNGKVYGNIDMQAMKDAIE